MHPSALLHLWGLWMAWGKASATFGVKLSAPPRRAAAINLSALPRAREPGERAFHYRSTIHLFDRKGLGPFGGINLSKSMGTPSLLNSLTHALITSSGAGLGGWRTISAVHPSVLSTQPAPLSWPV